MKQPKFQYKFYKVLHELDRNIQTIAIESHEVPWKMHLIICIHKKTDLDPAFKFKNAKLQE